MKIKAHREEDWFGKNISQDWEFDTEITNSQIILHLSNYVEKEDGNPIATYNRSAPWITNAEAVKLPIPDDVKVEIISKIVGSIKFSL